MQAWEGPGKMRNPSPETLNPKPSTPDPILEIRRACEDPGKMRLSETLLHTLYPRNLKAQRINPKFQTLNPNPQTQSA